MHSNTIFIIAQIIGVIGMTFGFLSYQNNKHKNIMLTKTVSEGTFALHYLLLKSYTGMAMDVISIIRNLLFARLVEKKKNTLPYIILFSCVMLVAGYFTWIGWISIFAVTGKILTTIAYGLKDAKSVRLVTIPSCISWLIYNVYCVSIAGICTEVFGLTSIFVAMIRFDRKKAKDAVEHAEEVKQ